MISSFSSLLSPSYSSFTLFPHPSHSPRLFHIPTSSVQMTLLRKLTAYGTNVLTNRQYFWHLFSYILLAELIFGCLIIHFVPCPFFFSFIYPIDTNIDWEAYMQQMHTALYKTLDYEQFMGETGPAVYPAGYVYVFSFLYKITNGGENVRLGCFIYSF